jgi:peptidyl-tRNA hydrolase
VKLKLTQSGGIAGKNMVAQVKSNLTEADWKELVDAIKKPKGKVKGKDMQSYCLQKETDDTPVQVDISAIPSQHTELFKALFSKMKAEK